MIILKDYKLPGSVDNGRPVSAFDADSNKAIGHYLTHAQCENLLIKKNRCVVKVVDKIKKDGTPRTIKDKTGRKIYFKSIPASEYKISPR